MKVDEFENCLKALEIKSGDVLFCMANLARTGWFEGIESKSELMDCFLNTLLTTIGKTGTLIVPTYTYSYGSKQHPFIYESSPSEVGQFTEHVRKHPEAHRSFHPLFSFAAIGHDKHRLCDDVSRSAFGVNSVFDRLYKLKHQTKVLCIGSTLAESVTQIIYVGQMFGITHYYNKAFFTPTYRGEQEVPGPFFSFVRDISVKNDYAFERYENYLFEQGLATKEKLGLGYVSVVDYKKSVDAAFTLIEQDAHYFWNCDYHRTT